MNKSADHRDIGRKSRIKGKRFEARIDESWEYYRVRGMADIEKTPEPMKVLKSLDNGRFVACFEKQAQPDYKGIIKGGREVMFEAKYTSSDRIEQSRVSDEQRKTLNRHEKLGARCYVIIGYDSGEVYKIPWSIWESMKEHFGHKYVTEQEVSEYRVPLAWNGLLALL